MRFTDCYVVHLRTAQHTLTAATRAMWSLALLEGDNVRLKGLLCFFQELAKRRSNVVGVVKMFLFVLCTSKGQMLC